MGCRLIGRIQDCVHFVIQVEAAQIDIACPHRCDKSVLYENLGMKESGLISIYLNTRFQQGHEIGLCRPERYPLIRSSDSHEDNPYAP